MDAAALHAEVPCVVEGEDGRLAQQLLEGMLPVDAVDADDLHALVHGVKEQLGAVHLAHGADHLAVVVVLVEVMRRLPAEVAARLDLRGDVAEDVSRVLVVDDRLRAAGRVGLGPVQRRLVGGASDADGGDAGHRPRPREVAVDEQVAVAARALDEVAGRHASVVEDDLGVRGQAVTDLADQLEGDARGAAVHHDRREPFGAALVRVGPHHDDARVCAVAVPAGDVARPVLAAVEHVVVSVARGGHADAHRLWQGRVEVGRAAGRPGRLAGRIADDVLAAWIGCRCT